jgi:hypothetical protein
MDCAAAVALHWIALGELLTLCDAAPVHQMEPVAAIPQPA